MIKRIFACDMISSFSTIVTITPLDREGKRSNTNPMICFRFSSRSSGKIEIGSQDLLDDPILLEEIVDDVLTSVLPGLVSLEELDEGIGAVGTFTSAGLGVVDAFISGKFFLRPAVSEISVT